MNNDNNGEFFVMLNTQNGGYTPLMRGTHDEEIAKFKTKELARKGALSSPLGEHFGYGIFEIGLGDS